MINIRMKDGKIAKISLSGNEMSLLVWLKLTGIQINIQHLKRKGPEIAAVIQQYYMGNLITIKEANARHNKIIEETNLIDANYSEYSEGKLHLYGPGYDIIIDNKTVQKLSIMP